MNKIWRKLDPRHPTWRGLLIESGLFLCVHVLWLVFRPSESPARALIGSLSVMAPMATAVLLVVLSLPKMEKQTRRAWTFLGVAFLLRLLGEFVRTYYLALIKLSIPSFSVAEVFNLFSYLFLFLAFIFFPSKHRYLPSRFRFLLDAIISSGVIAALGWLAIGRPAAQTNPGDLLGLIPLVYPVADLVFLMVLFSVFLGNPGSRRTSLLWGGSLLAFLASDYIYAYQSLIQNYQAGGAESLGWTIGSLLIGVSVLLGLERGKEVTKDGSNHDGGVGLLNILPIVLVLVLIWFVFADWRLRGEPSWFGVWMAIVMGMGLIVRLGVRAGEIELHQYWQLFRAISDPTFICDIQGNILLANPALERIIELGLGGVIKKVNLKDIFLWGSPQEAILERGTHAPTSHEIQLTGSRYSYLLSLSPIVTDNRRILIAGVAYDIQQQKKQREALQKAYSDLKTVSLRLEDLNSQLEGKVAERTQTLTEAFRQLEEQNKSLQDLDQMKTDFVSMVSHELRTPLTSINGGLELLLARKGRRPEDKDALLLMRKEVVRLTHFVENILNLSAMEAGRLDAQIEMADLALIVKDVTRALSHLPGSERIRVQIPEDLPPVLTDENIAHRVLIQLLDNALKYAPNGIVSLDAFKVKNRIRIRVSDEGPGVPPEKRKLMFGRFQRLQAGDSQSIYGYGLGLYLSRRLLRSMKSDLRYEPSRTGGACFYFDIKVTP